MSANDPKRDMVSQKTFDLPRRTRQHGRVLEFSAIKHNEKPQRSGGPGRAGASIFRSARNATLTLHVIPATV